MSDSEESDLDGLLSSPVTDFQDASQRPELEAIDPINRIQAHQDVSIPDASDDENENETKEEERFQIEQNDNNPPKKKLRLGEFESKKYSELAIIRRDATQLLKTLDQEHRSDLAVHLYALYLLSMNNSNPSKINYVRSFCGWPLKNSLNIPRQSGYEYIDENNILQERKENLITINEFVSKTTTQGDFISNIGLKKIRQPKYCDIEPKESLEEFTPTKELYAEFDSVFEKYIHKKIHENKLQNGIEMQPIIDPPITIPQVVKHQVVSKLNNTLDELIKGYAYKVGSHLKKFTNHGMSKKHRTNNRITWSNVSLCNNDNEINEKLENLFRFKRDYGDRKAAITTNHVCSFYKAKKLILIENKVLLDNEKNELMVKKPVKRIQMLPLEAIQRSKRATMEAIRKQHFENCEDTDTDTDTH